MKRLTALLVISLLLFQPSIAMDKPNLHIVGEAWHQLTLSNGEGLYFELVRQAYQDEYQLKFETMPWHRAKRLVEQHKADVLVGDFAYSSPFLLYSTMPLDRDDEVIALFDKSKVRITDIKDLVGKKVGTLTNYGFEQFLPQDIELIDVSAKERVSTMLNKGRIHAYLTYAPRLPIVDPLDQFEHTVVIAPQTLHLAFPNTQKGNALKAYFDRQMTQMQQNGRLFELLGKKRFELIFNHQN